MVNTFVDAEHTNNDYMSDIKSSDDDKRINVNDVIYEALAEGCCSGEFCNAPPVNKELTASTQHVLIVMVCSIVFCVVGNVWETFPLH